MFDSDNSIALKDNRRVDEIRAYFGGNRLKTSHEWTQQTHREGTNPWAC
jgi:hypothetical protein